MKIDLDELKHRASRAGVTPDETIKLVDRIRDLEGGLADALYWLKPGMTSTEARMQAMERDRANLVDLLHRELVTK